MTQDEKAILVMAKQIGARIHRAAAQRALVEEYLNTDAAFTANQWQVVTHCMMKWEEAIRLSQAEIAMLTALENGESVLAAKLSTP